MTQQNEAGEALHPVRKALDEHNITIVVVIDDAFDDPDLASFIGGEVKDFLEAIEDDEEANSELSDLGIDLALDEGLTDDHVKLLWERREELTYLRAFADTLFAAKLEMRAQIKDFIGHLEGVLKRKVVPLGRDAEFTELSAKVVFLDYYLGPAQNADSVKAASDYAKNIYSKFADAPTKPFLVLTSSATGVEKHKDDFRRAAGFLGGMFDFVSKADLCTLEKLLVKFDFWLMGFPISYEIQRFVDTIAGSAKSVTDLFLDRVRELNLNDYAYIQMLSLQADGNPLGEYMLWLYQSLFGHMLFESNTALRAELHALDSMRFDDFLPTQAMPSDQLSEIYMHALFDMTVGELAKHPHDADAEALDKRPYLQLGDVFIKDAESEIRMVINAQCDLAFSPTGGRICDPNSSILLIAGELFPLDKPVPKGNVSRTEFFKYKGESYRIAWYLERIRSIPRAQFCSTFKAEEYHREARLRMPFALEIQQAFSANLTRVGLPVPPPIYQLVTIQAYGKQPDDSLAPLHDPISDAGFIAPYRGTKGVEERLVLIASYVDTVVEHCASLAAVYEKQASDEATANNKKTQFKQSSKALRDAAEDFDLRRKLLKPLKLPETPNGNKVVTEKLITIRWPGGLDQSCRELIVVAVTPVSPPEPVADDAQDEAKQA